MLGRNARSLLAPPGQAIASGADAAPRTQQDGQAILSFPALDKSDRFNAASRGAILAGRIQINP